MKFPDTELPSNKKFGLFFSAIFSLVFVYCLFKAYYVVAIICATMASVLVYLAFTHPDRLLPFNKIWMRFGLVLGMIVSPIVIGLIFFVIFTPIGVLMRLFGRDELRLMLNQSDSHWKLRKPADSASESFKQQF